MESGEYLTVLPNDKFKGMSFIMATSQETFVGDDYTTDTFQQERTRQAALIFWVNLKAIDPTKDYPFTEELKEEVEIQLADLDNLSIVSYIDENYREVFNGLNMGQNNYLMYPYAAFRFNLILNSYGNPNC